MIFYEHVIRYRLTMWSEEIYPLIYYIINKKRICYCYINFFG